MNLGYNKVNIYFQKSSSYVLFLGFCLADPLPPARFAVSKEKTTSASLHVWWTPSSGKVTQYEVQLFDDNQKIQRTHIQKSTLRNEYTFFNLTAGSNYNITITAISGNKRSFTIYTNGSTGKTSLQIIENFIAYASFEITLNSRNGSKNVPRP